MHRFFLTVTATLISTLPLHADPMPHGEFMLGRDIWPSGFLSRYVTLFIENDELTVEVSNSIPLDFGTCDVTGDCVYAVTAATAQAMSDGGRVMFSNVEFAILPEEEWDSVDPVSFYADFLLGTMQGNELTLTDHGFSVSTAVGPVEFLRTDARARDVIRGYGVELQISMDRLDGCEVGALAPLMMADTVSPAEAAFRQAVVGLAQLAQIEQTRIQIDPIFGDITEVDDAQVRALAARRMLPFLLAGALHDETLPDAIEQVWTEFGTEMFDGARGVFDADVASYGDPLGPLSAFISHLANTDLSINAEIACQDLSFGFVAAQGG